MINLVVSYLYNLKSKKILFYLFILVLLILIFQLNRLFPLYAEDWDYRFIWEQGDQGSDKISSLYDVIISQYNHYIGWGGRSVVHTIDQILLMLDPGWSDFLNSIAFISFTLMIYCIANKNNNINIFVLLAIVFALYLLQPTFPTTVLWITGSTNYLWGTLIIVSFLYFYCAYYYKPDKGNNVFKMIGMFLFGILAGWTNENTGLGIIFFLIVLFFVFKYNKIPIPNWGITGFIGFVTGYTIMIMAPGNYSRLEHIQSEIIIGLNDILLMRLVGLYNHFIDYLLIPGCIYVFLLIVYITTTIGKNKRKIIILSLLFFVTAFVSHLAMIASPVYPQRALFGIIALIIIAIMIIYANIEIKNIKWQMTNLLAIGLLLFFSSIEYRRDYKYLLLVDEFWKERAMYVEQQKRQGIKDIVFEDKFDLFKDNYDFSDFSDNWLNHVYARHCEVETVKIK